MKEITLPLNEAVKLAAKENMERDLRVGLVEPGEVSDLFEDYLKEANEVLSSGGCNYAPEYDDHHMICVEGWFE